MTGDIGDTGELGGPGKRPEELDSARDRQLEAFLRQAGERLAPPSGSFETVIRRAKRRKWMKAGATIAAGVVIAAGAVPAVIGVRHNSNNQSLIQSNATRKPTIGTTHRATPSAASPSSPPPSPSTVPAVPTALSGFFPLSVSFVSRNAGYAWGTIGTSKTGVVAKTVDAGQDWTRLSSAPPVAAALNSAEGDGQIRFVNGMVGYIFGAKLFVTTDAGEIWTAAPSIGYVDDIEALNQKAWALARPSGQSNQSVQLYSATAATPAFAPVAAVHGLTALAGADSIAVNNKSVDVLSGTYNYWVSANGTTWHKRVDPCGKQVPNGATVQNALVSSAATESKYAVAACGYNISSGTEAKQIWTTTNFGARWKQTVNAPSDTGYLETLTVGPNDEILIGDARGGAQVTNDGGRSWQPDNASGTELAFVGFIYPQVIVALADRSDESTGAFAISTDAGKSWTTRPFN